MRKLPNQYLLIRGKLKFNQSGIFYKKKKDNKNMF